MVVSEVRVTTGQRYMGEVNGSDKRYAFSIPPERGSRMLHLFESAIDLLSFCTLGRLAGRNWQQEHLLSLAGIYRPRADIMESTPPAALVQYLQNHPQINHLVLRLDNDEPGRLIMLP